MKIALCMSGQARGVINGWQNICGNLLNPNAPDIFAHVWEDEKGEQVQAIRDLYKPVDMVVEHQRHFFNSITDVGRQRAKYPHGASRDDFVDRTYSMQYSILQANLVKERYRLQHDIHYDCVIRARFDLSFSRPVDCSKFDMSFMHVLDKCLPEMIDDRFAIATTNYMNLYATGFCFYDEINRIRSAKDGIFCGETILFEILQACGVPYRFIPNLQILRVSLE